MSAICATMLDCPGFFDDGSPFGVSSFMLLSVWHAHGLTSPRDFEVEWARCPRPWLGRLHRLGELREVQDSDTWSGPNRTPKARDATGDPARPGAARTSCHPAAVQGANTTAVPRTDPAAHGPEDAG